MIWNPLTIEAHMGQGQQHWDQVAEGEAGPGGGGQGGHWEYEAGADDVDQVKHRQENQQSGRKYVINKCRKVLSGPSPRVPKPNPGNWADI